MDLETRFKRYERSYKTLLTPRSYVIIRLDGKNFSKYTKGLVKPFDVDLSDAMNKTAAALVEEFNAKMAYTQSDEISLLITEIGGGVDAQPMFGNSLQKLCSLSASVATAAFNEVRNLQYAQNYDGMDDMVFPNQAFFDARVFIVPDREEAERPNPAPACSARWAARRSYSPEARAKGCPPPWETPPGHPRDCVSPIPSASTGWSTS